MMMITMKRNDLKGIAILVSLSYPHPHPHTLTLTLTLKNSPMVTASVMSFTPERELDNNHEFFVVPIVKI